MLEDDDNVCYFVGGPVDGKTYAMPKRLPEFRFPVFDEPHYLYRSNPDIDPDDIKLVRRAIYKHITQEIYWFVGIQ